MKEIATTVQVVSLNIVTDEEENEVLEGSEHDSLESYTESLEDTVEAIVATQLFGDADEIPVLSVNTEITEDFDEEDAAKLVESAHEG